MCLTRPPDRHNFKPSVLAPFAHVIFDYGELTTHFEGFVVARGISTHGWETVSWRVNGIGFRGPLTCEGVLSPPPSLPPAAPPSPMYVHCVAVYNGSFPTPALPKYPEATFQELGWEHGCASCAASASFDQCMRGCDSWPNYGCCSSSCASLCQRDVSLQQAAKEICEAACVSCYAPPPPPGIFHFGPIRNLN